MKKATIKIKRDFWQDNEELDELVSELQKVLPKFGVDMHINPNGSYTLSKRIILEEHIGYPLSSFHGISLE